MAIVGTNWLKDHAPDQLIAPQPVVPDGFCLDIGHRRHKERTGDVCTCAKYIRHPACDKHEVRPLLPETNPLLSAGKETTNE
jgi:hypothetical protein